MFFKKIFRIGVEFQSIGFWQWCKSNRYIPLFWVQNVVKEIKQYQKKWLQHVQRMDTNRLTKEALQYKPKGRRNIGRPRKRWRDQLHLEDQGTGNTPNPSGTWWWWWWILSIVQFLWKHDLSEVGTTSVSKKLQLCSKNSCTWGIHRGKRCFVWRREQSRNPKSSAF